MNKAELIAQIAKIYDELDSIKSDYSDLTTRIKAVMSLVEDIPEDLDGIKDEGDEA